MIEAIALDTADQDPLLKSLGGELDEIEARIKHIENIMGQLNSQKILNDRSKAVARNQLVNLALYAFEIEKLVLSYQTSDKDAKAFTDVIGRGLTFYFQSAEPFQTGETLREIIEIKVDNTRYKYENIDKMVQQSLSKAKEIIPNFKWQKPTSKVATVPLKSNSQNNTEEQQGCFGSSLKSFFNFFKCSPFNGSHNNKTSASEMELERYTTSSSSLRK